MDRKKQQTATLHSAMRRGSTIIDIIMVSLLFFYGESSITGLSTSVMMVRKLVIVLLDYHK